MYIAQTQDTAQHRFGVLLKGENFSSKNFCPGSRTGAGGAIVWNGVICFIKDRSIVFAICAQIVIFEREFSLSTLTFHFFIYSFIRFFVYTCGFFLPSLSLFLTSKSKDPSSKSFFSSLLKFSSYIKTQIIVLFVLLIKSTAEDRRCLCWCARIEQNTHTHISSSAYSHQKKKKKLCVPLPIVSDRKRGRDKSEWVSASKRDLTQTQTHY